MTISVVVTAVCLMAGFAPPADRTAAATEAGPSATEDVLPRDAAGHGRPRGGQPAGVRAEIARLVAGDPPLDGYAAHRWQHVGRLYRGTDHGPLWIDGARARARATALLDAVSDAPAHALRLDAYPLEEARDALRTLPSDDASAEAGAAIARADVLLSATFVAYSEDLLTGQVDPRSVNREWHIDPRDVDVDSALARSLRHESFAEALALLGPQDPDYAALRAALARYRGIVAAGGWPEVPAVGVLRPGDTTSAGRLGPLLARLHVEGHARLTPLVSAGGAASPRGDAAPVVYDSALAGAVSRYQRLHGLAVDGVVGPNTLASLNQPAEFRTRQIAANLERHRWMPRTRGDRYVIVNVPAFRLRAYDDGREVLSMRVVVGAEYGRRTTPVFSDSMAYVVFRPYWNVPQGIASRELWPEQRRDPSYFRRSGYEVVRASWGTYVRQKPAPDNALGQAKFIFPNDFAIYLHDTPAEHLFAERTRAFSHGCVRVERPAELAAFALGWELDRVRAAMERGADDTRIYLERKLPVYIVYFTAFTRDGTLHFAGDVYDRDDALVRAMRGAALDVREVGREHRADRHAKSGPASDGSSGAR
ncbi:MAG: L,D-transpeptidase family protein [Gemmatirosa sp.]